MSTPTTDAVRLLISLDPVMTEALDAARGKTPLARFVLERLAKDLKLKKHIPRPRGRTKKQPDYTQPG